MTKEKFKRCPECGENKVMTDELRRGYNAKDSQGRTICSECFVLELYKKAGL